MRGPRCTPRLGSLGLACGLRGALDSAVHEDKEHLSGGFKGSQVYGLLSTRVTRC